MPLTDDVVTGGSPVVPVAPAAGGSTAISPQPASRPRNPAAAAQLFDRQPVAARASADSAVITAATGDLTVQPAPRQPEYYANRVTPVLRADPNRYFATPPDTGTRATTGDSAGDAPQRGYGKLAYLPGSRIPPPMEAGGSSATSSSGDNGGPPPGRAEPPGKSKERQTKSSGRSRSGAFPTIAFHTGASKETSLSKGGIEVTIKAKAELGWSHGRGKVTVTFDPFEHEGRLAISDHGVTITDKRLYQQDARAMMYSLQHPGPVFPWSGSMSLQKKWPVEISVHGRKITAEGKVTASVYHSAGEVGGSVEVEVSKRTPKDGVVAAIYSIDVSAKAKPGKRYSDAELYAAIAVALGALLLSTGAVVLVRRG